MTEPKRTKRVKPELVKLADSLLANYRKPEDLIGEKRSAQTAHQDARRTSPGS